MHRRLPRLGRLRTQDERGAVVVIVVLSLIAMMGMIVLTVDVGGLLLTRRAMVNGSDAAALAVAKTCTNETDTNLPEDESDLFAMANVDGLVAEDGGITELVNCHPATGANGVGYVTVQYSKPQKLFFAPVLGFDSSGSVTTAATVQWGPLADGITVPIVLDSGYLQSTCHIPDQIAVNTPCNLYYNNGDSSLGDANWGYMNLAQWNVAKDYAHCSNASSLARQAWILHDYPDELTLNGDPPGIEPTYVCNDTGHAASNWQDLEDRRNQNPILYFPVNDCDEQVDRDGVKVPCPSTPDKYDIVAFTELFLVAVLKGDDPVAVGTAGTPAQNGNCGSNGANLTLDVNGQQNLAVLAAASCGAPKAPDVIPYTSVVVTRKQGSTTTTFKKCLPNSGVQVPPCDYEYDQTTKVLTWKNAVTRFLTNKMVKFTWTINATASTPGLCGLRLKANGQGDPNSICLVTKWLGNVSTVGTPGSGQSFGVFGYVLCDRELGTCPDQS